MEEIAAQAIHPCVERAAQIGLNLVGHAVQFGKVNLPVEVAILVQGQAESELGEVEGGVRIVRQGGKGRVEIHLGIVSFDKTRRVL